MYNKISSLLSGTIFGIGLTISGMTNPAKVIGFLDITGNWDPSLMFVMLGAIIFSMPLFYLLKKKNKPFFSLSFQLPDKKGIDKKLIIGSGLFGIGWGMTGLCPGPAVSSLVFLNPISIIFFISMITGFFITKLIKL